MLSEGAIVFYFLKGGLTKKFLETLIFLITVLKPESSNHKNVIFDIKTIKQY